MDAIIVDVNVDENHNTTLQLPDVPPGNVRLEIRIVQESPAEGVEPNSREFLLAKLKAAGVFVEGVDIEDEELLDYKEMTDEEEEIFGRSLAASRPMEDYVFEDREERF